DPNYVDAQFNRGNALLALRRFTDALASFGKVLDLKPDFPQAYNNRASALSALGRYDQALASHDRALALKPDHVDARFNRAGVLAKLERYDDAIADYETVRQVNPDLPDLLDSLARCYAAACRWPLAQQLADEVLAKVDSGGAGADPFTMLGFDCTPAQQLAIAQSWLRSRHIVTRQRKWSRSDFAGEKIRVAYLSADFHSHVT